MTQVLELWRYAILLMHTNLSAIGQLIIKDETFLLPDAAVCGHEWEKKNAPGHLLEDDEVRDDVECKLCFAVLCEPTTTICGHTFCRACLVRTLDHNPACPLCRTSLLTQFAAHRQSGHLMRNSSFCPPDHRLYAYLQAVLPADMQRRRLQIAAQEHVAYPSPHLNPLSASAPAETAATLMQDGFSQLGAWIGVFVCNVALPAVKYPLHVFEPRYRLMIRRDAMYDDVTLCMMM